MFIPFEKWHGCKNDFIVLWMLATDRDTVFESLKRLATKICARDGSGVGADGILVLEVKSRKDMYPETLHIVNSDGSLAANCGNGLRCAAMSVRRNAHKQHTTEIDGVTFNVLGNSIDCRFIGKSTNPFVAVTMPEPKLNSDNSWNKDVSETLRGLAKSLRLNITELSTVDIGNPHVVCVLSEASADICQAIGKPMQIVRGGDGINVHSCHEVEISDRDKQRAKADVGEPIGALFKVWPWERGAGATQACGTGACAVAVSTYDSGTLNRSDWVACEMPGGRLYAKQSAASEDVILAGPAQFVFSGEIEI